MENQKINKNRLVLFNKEKNVTEIINLKQKTAENIIKIGKNLIELKENLPYGEFEKTLKEEVNFSKRTAYNFMKVAKTFSDVQSIAQVETTKLFLLAGLEEETREKIMKENDVNTMTTRELENVIREKPVVEIKVNYSNMSVITKILTEPTDSVRLIATEVANALSKMLEVPPLTPNKITKLLKEKGYIDNPKIDKHKNNPIPTEKAEEKDIAVKSQLKVVFKEKVFAIIINELLNEDVVEEEENKIEVFISNLIRYKFITVDTNIKIDRLEKIIKIMENKKL